MPTSRHPYLLLGKDAPAPDDANNPMDVHRYLYVRNNPVNHIDPLGFYDWDTGHVESGDTLWQISRDAGVSIEDILRWNSHIKDRNLIKVGQYLWLPQSARNSGQSAVARRDSSKSEQSSYVYKPDTSNGCGVNKSCPPQTGCDINKSCNSVKVYLFSGHSVSGDWNNTENGLSDIDFGSGFEKKLNPWDADVYNSAEDAFSKGYQIALVGHSCGGMNAIRTAQELGSKKVALVISLDAFCHYWDPDSSPTTPLTSKYNWKAYYQTNSCPSAANLYRCAPIPGKGIGRHDEDVSYYKVLAPVTRCKYRMGKGCTTKMELTKVAHSTIDDLPYIQHAVRLAVQSIRQ